MYHTCGAVKNLRCKIFALLHANFTLRKMLQILMFHSF